MTVTLTGRVPYQISLPIFEGPLDLLLHLIRENRIDIYDIPIATITEQYLQYLSLMEALDLEIAGDFIVMAATLIEIKSKTLLPPSGADQQDEEDPIDPRAELVERLLEYEKYKQAASMFREWEEEQQRLFARGETDYDSGDIAIPFDEITSFDLLGALRRMLEEVGEGEEEVTSIRRRRLTIRMKMSEIWRRVKESSRGILFEELFDGPRTRTDIIITFLAMLELLKLRRVKALQPKPFGGIEIHYNPESAAPNE